jgi:hypothetical protein
VSLNGYVLLGNRMLAVKQIRSVRWHDDDCDGFIVTGTWGPEIDVLFVEALCAFGRIIPAQPGFFTLHAIEFDDWTEEETVASATSRSPVLAWVAFRGSVYPLTLNGHEQYSAVLCPDGRVDDQGSAYDSLDEWFEEAKRVRLMDRLKGENPEQPPKGGA